jgi:NAD(P)-dependent dehydrogenase (short-subunit alcohol dehydrogenase family)
MPFPTHDHESLADLLSLRGRRVVLTGASHGIGARIAHRLAEAGADLALAARTAEEIGALAAELSAPGRTVVAIPTDMSQPEQVAHLAAEAARTLGGIDVWINDAGLLAVGDALTMTSDEWDTLYAVNVRGVFLGCQAAARHMKDHGGTILNVASSLAFHVVPGQAHYVSSKWAVRGLTAALASEWGQHGIRVLAIAPGLTHSDGMDALMDQVAEAQGGDPTETFAKQYPAKRLGEPDDVARMAVVLVSGLGGFVTGSTVLVDGGEVYGSPSA